MVDIDCRSTLCRLEVAHDDPQAEAYFQGLFSGLISNSLVQSALIHTDQSDGWNSTVIYLTREGYELPEEE